MTIIAINWETDGQIIDLPDEVELPDETPTDEIADILSDRYGWLVNSFTIK